MGGGKYGEFRLSILRETLATRMTTGILNFFEKENSQGLFGAIWIRLKTILGSHDFSKEFYMNKLPKVRLPKDRCSGTAGFLGLREGYQCSTFRLEA